MIMGPKRAGELFDQMEAEIRDLQCQLTELRQRIYDEGSFHDDPWLVRFNNVCDGDWKVQELCREIDDRESWLGTSIRAKFVKGGMWRNDPDEPSDFDPPTPTDNGPSFPRVFTETEDVPGLGDIMTARAFQRWIDEGLPARRSA